MRKVVKFLIYGVEERKVDVQGRLVLLADWRLRELSDGREVFVIKGKGFLKVVPKKRVDLTRFFDSVDLGTNLGDWEEFKKEFYEVS